VKNKTKKHHQTKITTLKDESNSKKSIFFDSQDKLGISIRKPHTSILNIMLFLTYLNAKYYHNIQHANQNMLNVIPLSYVS